MSQLAVKLAERLTEANSAERLAFLNRLMKLYSSKRKAVTGRPVALLRLNKNSSVQSLVTYLTETRRRDVQMIESLSELLQLPLEVKENSFDSDNEEEDEDEEPEEISSDNDSDDEHTAGSAVNAVLSLTKVEMMLLGVFPPNRASDEDLRAFLLDLRAHGEELPDVEIPTASREQLERAALRMMHPAEDFIVSRANRVAGEDDVAKEAAVLSALTASTEQAEADVQAFNLSLDELVAAAKASLPGLDDADERQRAENCLAMLDRVRKAAAEEQQLAEEAVVERESTSALEQLRAAATKHRTHLTIGSAVLVVGAAFLLMIRSGVLVGWKKRGKLSIQKANMNNPLDRLFYAVLESEAKKIDLLFRSASAWTVGEMSPNSIAAQMDKFGVTAMTVSLFREDQILDRIQNQGQRRMVRKVMQVLAKDNGDTPPLEDKENTRILDLASAVGTDLNEVVMSIISDETSPFINDLSSREQLALYNTLVKYLAKADTKVVVNGNHFMMAGFVPKLIANFK